MLDLLVQLNNSKPLQWPLEVREFDQNNSQTFKGQCTGDRLTTESWRNPCLSCVCVDIIPAESFFVLYREWQGPNHKLLQQEPIKIAG
jgi:hypothetical protein